MTSQNDSVADPRLLPNPLTPLAFVAPKDAYTVAIAAYVLIGALSWIRVEVRSGSQFFFQICMWDGLHCLSQDYVLLFKKKIGISTIVYVLSRIFTFIFALMVSIFAIYNRNKYVSVVFFTLWLVLLGYSLSLVTFIKGTNIGPTDYCTYAPLEVRDSATGIIFFTYDTLVFMAISWRLFSIFHVDDNPQKGLKAVVFGRCLPAFSKALLHDGQVYYLMSLATVLLSLALFFSTNLPTQMRAVFSVFTVTITNIMACPTAGQEKVPRLTFLFHWAVEMKQ
ncbi:hypothetical protein BDQ12DRAFT_670566 [Crucibulum laeve]|uniref:Transmembrane protein n=1 Tax=Crucibulum laeve TaxID=68775 RepID=A0A5C3LK06_9AGAR|nr:hypothetical protein BDQ12DRAFT_670566 [Crucibulum laeve]